MALGTVVRIVKNQAKEFSSSKKESYEHLSPYFVILDVDKSREIWTYKVGNLLNMKLLRGTYGIHELVAMKIGFKRAREKEEKNIVKILRKTKDICHFRVRYEDMIINANLSILNKPL